VILLNDKGGTTGMTVAMALLGMQLQWPVMALSTALFAPCTIDVSLNICSTVLCITRHSDSS